MANVIGLDVTTLNQIVERIVKSYARPTFGGLMLYVGNSKHQVYSVMCLTAKETAETQSHLIVLVRIVDHQVVVHVNNSPNNSLVDDLLNAGIPREQIHLVYEGESSRIPDHQINDPLP